MIDNLIMISAMYENGGNTLLRHLDGHPELFTYPFESQLGTKYVMDDMTSLFPFKYRWPEFPCDGEPESDFELIFDEELKTRLRRPDGSKFREVDLQIGESARRDSFIQHMKEKERSRKTIVAAFFAATFDNWTDYRKTGREKIFVGYSPIVGVDGDRILNDFPGGFILHIVRNPVAACAETRRRPYPLSIGRYSWIWSFVQHRALYYQEKYKNRFIILRYEDLISHKKKTMEQLCVKLGILFDESLLSPSFNGRVLQNQYPWGTIDFPTAEEQETREKELNGGEVKEIMDITRLVRKEMGY